MLRDLAADLRLAARSLSRSPLHAASAILTLALGLTAVTTVASWVRGVLLSPLPGVADADRFVVIADRSPSGEAQSLSYPDFLDLSASPELAGMIVQRGASVNVAVHAGDEPLRVGGGIVSGRYFDVLGVRPVLGRGFTAEEDRAPGAPPAAVLSHVLWQKLLGGDAHAVGGSIQVNGNPVTVVGIAPPDFPGTFMGIATDIWLPTAIQPLVEPGTGRLQNRGDRWLQSLAKLAPGVSISKARAALTATAVRLAKDHPDTNANHTLFVLPPWKASWGAQSVLRPILMVLGGLVTLVLLLVAANVANLLLSRLLSRRRDLAVRLALGAKRLDLVRPLLAESLLLSSVSAVVALLAALGTSRLLMAFVPPTEQRISLQLGVDAGVVATAVLGALVAGLLVGLLPALVLSRHDLEAGLREPLTSGQRPPRLLSTLVALQVALSVILLVAAGLFLKTVRAARSLDPGFTTRGISLATFDLFPLGYAPARGKAFLGELVEKAAALPGVSSVSLVRRAPLGLGGTSSTSVAVEGYTPTPGEESNVLRNYVGPRYFATLGIPLVRGRDFASTDRDGAPQVMVVNQAFVRRYFAGRGAVGGRVRVGERWFELVGVAADSAFQRLGETPVPMFYTSVLQDYRTPATLVVRTQGGVTVVPALRDLVKQLDPALPLYDVETMEERLSEALIAQRIASALLGVLGLAALLLSAVGLYGMVSWAVGQRGREIGVRMALGASSGDVLRDVVGRGLQLLALGAVPGLLLAFAGTRVLRNLLPGVSPSDPATYGAVVALLSTVALLAAWLPARRAASLDPAAALRGE